MGEDSRTPKTILRKLKLIKEMQWQCLRRNGVYITDCEKWSHRKSTEWPKTETILKSPNLKALQKPFEALPMDENYRLVLQIGADGSWRPYQEKHRINLPVNPNCPTLPFGAEIVSNGIISDHVCSKQSIEDFFKKNISTIHVNWSAPVRYLLALFEHMMREKRRQLSAASPNRKIKATYLVQIKHERKVRVMNAYEDEEYKVQFKRMPYRLDNFKKVMRAWDLRREHGDKITYSQIAKIVYKKQTRKPTDAAIKKQLDKAERLIEGVYQTFM